jgi:hypothetical protein
VPSGSRVIANKYDGQLEKQVSDEVGYVASVLPDALRRRTSDVPATITSPFALMAKAYKLLAGSPVTKALSCDPVHTLKRRMEVPSEV